MSNKPGLSFEFIPGIENVGADLLSRPTSGKGKEDNPRPNTPEVNQISLWDEIWDEHMKFHWGVFKTYCALRRKGSKATWNMVKRVYETCEVCAKFRHWRAHVKFGEPPYSLEPGHTLYVVGPLVYGRGGLQYIHCLVDNATRMGDAMALRSINSRSVIRVLHRRISKYGIPKVLMTDNAAYYTSAEFDSWCQEMQIKRMVNAPIAIKVWGWLNAIIRR